MVEKDRLAPLLAETVMYQTRWSNASKVGQLYQISDSEPIITSLLFLKLGQYLMSTMGQESALKIIYKKLTQGLELAIYLRPKIGTFGLPLQLVLLLA